LAKVSGQLPKDVQPNLGPDATGVGWVLEYALVDRSGKNSLADLTAFQNWHFKYALQSVKGVAEVATIGGMGKQYQITLKPDALLAHQLSVNDVVMAVQKSNQETGARLLDIAGREHMITLHGYVKSLADLESIVLKTDTAGNAIKVKDVAEVAFGPDIRRGLADLDGQGEVVGGVVIMRDKENALDVIDRVKAKLHSVTLPKGTELVITYDRSDLIKKAIHTLKKELFQEMFVVSLLIFIFLLHLPSAFIPIITLPIAVILAFIPMYFMKLTSNVMSLGGIAIAIGAMVDASIVVIENAHKKMSHWSANGQQGDFKTLLLSAVQEVGAPSFYALLVIAVSFIPIFTLTGMEGRLFTPLAFTKNFAMLFSAILAVTLVPALIFLLIHPETRSLKGSPWRSLAGKIYPEEDHPISRSLIRWYEPVVRFVLEHPRKVIAAAILVFAVSMPLFLQLGSEFMPPLNEGTILYMPTTPPGISVASSQQLLRAQDQILRSFPEVTRVFGKAGRADTATDPAPYSMMETVVQLKPQNEWRHKDRWYSQKVPNFLQAPLRMIWPDRVSWEELTAEMDQALQLPGQVNAWTMPIKSRIDMLTTGVRTPVGIKIYGDDLARIEEIGTSIEELLKPLKGTRSIYAERTSGGYFVNIDPDREALARYGINIADMQMTLMSAVGGENISQTIEGRERFPINVRYPRELRDDPEALKRIYLSTSSGAQIPLSLVANVSLSQGPAMIRDENGSLAGYVYIDVAGRDIGTYVSEAKQVLQEHLSLPPGYSISFSGQYEFMERAKARMKIVLPITLLIIFFLLLMNTGSMVKTLIILLAVPFSLIGVAWILYALHYQMSIGVWAGIIALLGVDAETGVFMLLYLDLSYDERRKQGLLRTISDLKEAIVHGAAKRIRPKMMTVGAMFIGLLPILWAQSFELGADMTKRIAAPLMGGILSSFLMELLIYPAIYYLWKKSAKTFSDQKRGEII
jgi:Cu(I)/Ag(I) efflux system membrane protein CusA/SilA